MDNCPWAPAPAFECGGVILAACITVIGASSKSNSSLPSSLAFFFFFGVSLLRNPLILSLLDGFPLPSFGVVVGCLGEGEGGERSKRTDVGGIAVVETDRSNGLGGLDTAGAGRLKGSEKLRRPGRGLLMESGLEMAGVGDILAGLLRCVGNVGRVGVGELSSLGIVGTGGGLVERKSVAGVEPAEPEL